MKKFLFLLLILWNASCLFSEENDWDIIDPAKARNTAAHELARAGEKYFGASCMGAHLLNKWYLFSDVALGEPKYLNNAPQAWRIARNFDMNWVRIPGNMPIDFFIGREQSSTLTIIKDMALRSIVGWGVSAAVLTGHELGHSLARYLLTGTKATIYIGSSWSATLGLLKKGVVDKPLASLFNGRFILRGLCLNTGVSCPDIDTERLYNYPTWKGVLISMAGGVSGIGVAKAIKGISYLLRHKDKFNKNKSKVLKKTFDHCCTLDNCTLFNLYNMLYPTYGLDAYYLWWYLAYQVQKDPVTAITPNTSAPATK